ncbi:hypothetical protein [Epilithonimonas sp. UC225_85]|uniref:hypothetical protein n=1 Tax=Epilithonimonas sp. UC225_85 TaxID=3350167 RepID=UPI0036D3E4ED
MKKYKFQVLIIVIFIISLFFNAIIVSDYNGSIKYNGGELLLSGFFAFLGGGIFETIIWTANPLFLNSIIFSRKYPQIAILFSILSFGLSLSFLFWNEILVSENGRMGKIIEFNFGYWIWIMSILLLNLYNIYSIIIKIKNKTLFKKS